jgi:hypothetical protein
MAGKSGFLVSCFPHDLWFGGWIMGHSRLGCEDTGGTPVLHA